MNRDYNDNRYGSRGMRDDRMRRDDDRRHDEDRSMFERMGDAIRDTWNEWTGKDAYYNEGGRRRGRFNEEPLFDHDRNDRSRDREERWRGGSGSYGRNDGRDNYRDWDRGRDMSRGRGYNSDDYRTSGIRGGYMPDRGRESYLAGSDYDYGTGNYTAQGMGSMSDRDFTYANRGHNAGSANIRGRRFYDYNSDSYRDEPQMGRERNRDSYPDRDRNWNMRRNDDRSYGTGRSRSERPYEDDDYTSHGEIGNDAYGAGRMGGYHDGFPEDFRYRHWKRGSR